MAEKKSKLVEIKTKQTTENVDDFIQSIAEEQKKKDCYAVLEIMKKATGEEPKMWGNSLIGFGKKRYKSPATGREVDWMVIGFAPRKANLSIYLTMNIKKQEAILKKLGKHKTGVGCLYINKLTDVDLTVLQDLINLAAKDKLN